MLLVVVLSYYVIMIYCYRSSYYIIDPGVDDPLQAPACDGRLGLDVAADVGAPHNCNSSSSSSSSNNNHNHHVSSNNDNNRNNNRRSSSSSSSSSSNSNNNNNNVGHMCRTSMTSMPMRA